MDIPMQAFINMVVENVGTIAIATVALVCFVEAAAWLTKTVSKKLAKVLTGETEDIH